MCTESLYVQSWYFVKFMRSRLCTYELMLSVNAFQCLGLGYLQVLLFGVLLFLLEYMYV